MIAQTCQQVHNGTDQKVVGPACEVHHTAQDEIRAAGSRIHIARPALLLITPGRVWQQRSPSAEGAWSGNRSRAIRGEVLVAVSDDANGTWQQKQCSSSTETCKISTRMH